MGIKERREKEKAELKKKILCAAEELFSENGYQNISMRKIAEKIEYSLPTIYQFFENKADILFHIYIENNGRLLDQFMNIEKKEMHCIEKLKEMANTYIHFALENPHYYELAYMSNALKHEQNLIYNDLDSPGFKAYELLLTTVKECQKQGYFLAKDASVISQCLWAGMHGLASLLIGHSEFPWKDKECIIQNMLDSLVGNKPQKE